MPRASRVVFVVMTDGQENSMREFKDRIVKMIKQKIDADNWQFVFLSADPDAVNDAINYGFAPDAAMAYQKSAWEFKLPGLLWLQSSRLIGGGAVNRVARQASDRDGAKVTYHRWRR